jgi:hypothetical protein
MIMNDKVKDLVETELYNFIDFYTSDDEERENMKKHADDYLEEEFSYEPERTNVLEEKAWLHITGEEVSDTLKACCSEAEALEYNRLSYGDEE